MSDERGPLGGIPTDESLPIDFGKYRLIEHIARGGMGEVYLATLSGEFGFEKQLVVKLIRPDLVSDQRFVELFAAEANTAVSLEHPNIVPIYELGRTDDGTLYIAMGRVNGPSVHAYLQAKRGRREPPDIGAALRISHDVLEGLAYAHNPDGGRAPIVHRDVSTRNVLLDRSGRALLVDFGIAMPAEENVESRMGSSGYMAPEQARAVTVDPRADVFSVTCILYELLTHERAFPKDGIWSPPSMSAVPDSLRDILVRGLSLDPRERPETAGAMLREFGPLVVEHDSSYGSQDLAGAIRAIAADASQPTSSGAETPVTRPTQVTTAFATRLTPLPEVEAGSRADGNEHIVADDPRAELAEDLPARFDVVNRSDRRPFVFGAALLGIGALGLGIWWIATVAPAMPPPAERISSARPEPTESRETADPQVAEDPTEAATEAPPTALAVTLSVKPGSARVAIDDQPVEGPPYLVQLDPIESVAVDISADGFTSEHLNLTAQQAGDLRVELRRKGKGRLTVTAPEVGWAIVRLDGKRIGQTPLVDHEVEAGPHRLSVVCPASVCGREETLDSRKLAIASGKVSKIDVRGR